MDVTLVEANESLPLGDLIKWVAQGWWCPGVTHSSGALKRVSCDSCSPCYPTHLGFCLIVDLGLQVTFCFVELHSHSFKFYLFLRLARVSFCCLQLQKSNKYIFEGSIPNKKASKLEKVSMDCTLYNPYRYTKFILSMCLHTCVCVYVHTYKLHSVKIISPIPAIIHGWAHFIWVSLYWWRK